MRISDWSSDVCSSDLDEAGAGDRGEGVEEQRVVRGKNAGIAGIDLDIPEGDAGAALHLAIERGPERAVPDAVGAAGAGPTVGRLRRLGPASVGIVGQREKLPRGDRLRVGVQQQVDRKSTRLNSSH